MILADTSIWIDHLRAGDPQLTDLLNAGRILIHPFVIGEIALGSLRERDLILSLLGNLPKVDTADHDEVIQFVERNSLFGIGIGYVDVHLLAAVRLTPGATLWTRDRRLSGAANGLGLSHDPRH